MFKCMRLCHSILVMVHLTALYAAQSTQRQVTWGTHEILSQEVRPPGTHHKADPPEQEQTLLGCIPSPLSFICTGKQLQLRNIKLVTRISHFKLLVTTARSFPVCSRLALGGGRECVEYSRIRDPKFTLSRSLEMSVSDERHNTDWWQNSFSLSHFRWISW
jgi:hypothetical protein